MVSVVIITYNVEKYITRCIESVINQTYSDIEIIIVNSDSTDRTGDICRQYAKLDSRINYVHKESEGPGAARTRGFEKSTGKYITFVDGDDWLEDDAVEILYKKAEELQADIVLGDILYVFEDIETETLLKSYSKIRLDEQVCISGRQDVSIINKCRTFTWGKLYRREFLKENRFAQNLYTYEDLATVPVLFAQAKKVGYVNKPIYNYLRNRGTSLVNDKSRAKEMVIALSELNKNFYRLDDYEYFKDELKRLMWGQIRFVCLKHPICMVKENFTDSLYEKMICVITECFDDFIEPDKCDVRVINAEYAKIILKNILINDDAVRYITDSEDCRRRILVSYEGKELEYCLENISEDEVVDESKMWNAVDDIFRKIWC